MIYDLLLEGGTVIDGTGRPGFRADVGIQAETIAAIGDLSGQPAKRRLDCRTFVVLPGFIDIHSHCDCILTLPPERQLALMAPRLLQGITTELVGNCGLGFFPLAAGARQAALGLQSFLVPEGARSCWQSVAEYLRFLEENTVPVNVGALVPHGPVRLSVMGTRARFPTPREKARLVGAVQEGLAEGAWGLSFGLIYPPGQYARTEEIVALAEAVGRCGAFVAFHQRSGSPEVVGESVAEIIQVGQEAEAHVHISHDHVQGRQAWELVPAILAQQQEARRRGVQLTADVIPYTGVTTTMLALYPPWALEKGVEGFLRYAQDPACRRRMRQFMEEAVPRWPPWAQGGVATNIVRDCTWEQVVVGWVRSERHKDCEGLSALELGERCGSTPFDAVTDLLIEEGGAVALRLYGISGDRECDEPLRCFLRDPSHAVISDAWDIGRGRPHPGVAGAFPRLLGRYVRELRCLSLQEAVRKATFLPAQISGISTRGRLCEGFPADVVVCNPETIADRATYQEPRRPPSGISYVLVNGQVVVDNGRIVAQGGAGKVLRRGEA